MINQAMFVKRDHFNEFTSALRMICDNADQNRCLVKLRNGTLMYVKYQEAKSNTEDNTFHTEDWDFCWFPDGSSCKSEDFDIVAMGPDI